MDIVNKNLPTTTLDLPPMGLRDRICQAARLAWRILRTGDHVVAEALADGMRIGMDGGFAAALGECNAMLAAQGIDPIRGV